MKQAEDLSCDQIVALIQSIQEYLYLDCDQQGRSFWNPEKPWTGDEFSFIAEALAKYDLVPRETSMAAAANQPEPCDCQLPGEFCSGVPGILAKVENCRLVLGGKVERCDLCQRYPSDQAAYEKLAELGMV